MSTIRFIPAMLLLTSLVAAGAASASPCPSCTPGSGDNWWSDLNVGAVGNETGPVHHGLNSGAVENTGVGLAHSDDKKGFWSYVTLCFDAWAQKLSDMTHLKLGLHGKANVYADSHVIDAKANVMGVDSTKIVKVNDTTWKPGAMARATLVAHGVVVPTVPALPTERLPEVDGRVCVDAKVTVRCV